MVDTHVTDCAQTQFCNLREPVLHLLLNDIFTDKFVELFDCIATEKSRDTGIAKCDIDKSFEQVDQILCLFINDVFWFGVAYE